MSLPPRSIAPVLAAWAMGVVLCSSPALAQSPASDEEGPSPDEVGAALAPDETETASTATDAAPLDLSALRDELKESLRQEIKAELREELLGELEDARGAPLQPAVAPIEDDGWAEEGWKWEEPVRPELDLLELDGFFRFRYDWFAGLDLGTYYNRGSNGGAQLEQGPFVPGFSPPTPLCNTNVIDRGVGSPGDDPFREAANSCANRQGNSNVIEGANVRFRLAPTLNVYEDVQIHAQIDVFDNLVLGSTPDSLTSPFSPLAALSQTQISPTAGFNTVLRDAIRVKRVWAEVMTPLGQLSFGRMPNHVGMGIFANDGTGLDMDFGDTVDRIQFATQVGDFTIAPAFDFAATGASSANLLLPQGQPFDRDPQDDVDQYVLTISKMDSPEVIARKLANDEVTFDVGTQQIYRTQTLDSSVGTSGIAGQATSNDTLRRGAEIYQYSWWAELRWRDLTLSAEYAGIIGRIDNVATGAGPDDATLFGADDGGIDLNQHGGALKASYKLLNDALTIELLVLGASGDDAPGWGVFPLYGGADGFGAGAWDGNQAPGGDGTISNFRFDPDFIVDLIFWRQLVGLVTDALVIRPSVQYDLTKQLGGRLDVIYSRSWFAESTPSGGLPGGDSDLGGPDENLGVEADVTLFYRSEQGFNAQLQYGVFFPMDGLDRLVDVEPELGIGDTLGGRTVQRLDSQIAHTLQLMLGVTF